MRKIAIVSLFILLACSFKIVKSQENYQKGYLINNSGDTLYGFIDYRNWDRSPENILFKSNQNDKGTAFSPIDIKMFAVSDDIYYGAIVKVDPNSYKVGNLDYLYKIEMRTDTIFLRTLIVNEKGLYLHKDKNGKDHFFIKNGLNFELLSYKMYFNDDKKIIEDNRYKGQLLLYFNNDLKVKSLLTDLKYDQQSLEKIFEKFYGKKKSSTLSSSEKKVKTDFGVLLGLSSTKLSFEGSGFEDLENLNAPASNNVYFGLFLNFIFPRKMGKWSICNELVYNSYKTSGQSITTDFIDRTSINDITIGYTYLRMNNLLRYKYPIKSFYIYANAGFTNGFAISENNYKKVDAPVFETEGKALDETRDYEQGYVLGLGANYNKFSFEIRYVRGNGMSEYTALSSKTKQFCFLLSYTL